jgi:hypothetical protein
MPLVTIHPLLLLRSAIWNAFPPAAPVPPSVPTLAARPLACLPADDDEWHQRLVRYYGRFGFRTVRDVQGNSLADLPHMLVWGGAGTRMDADMVSMLRRWSTAIRRNSAAAALAGGGDSATDGETSAAAAEAGAHPVATASWQDD